MNRFIPAPAGNANVASLDDLLRDGSSPRLRGTRVVGARDAAGGRFIPAPAGNASSSHSIWPLPPVHPRACGERRQLERAGINGGGSSPRLRGTPIPTKLEHDLPRFIPAPAGNADNARAP